MTAPENNAQHPTTAPLTPTQQRKLRTLLADAAANVPWYRREFGRLGLSDGDLAEPGVLRQLPVVTKSALLDAPLEERLNSRFDTARLATETTTGSTGQPFSIYIDPGYRRRRNLRFLRGLLAAGYRPWQRLMLLTDRSEEPVTRRHGWHYCSIEQPTAAIAEAYLRLRPTTLYGFTTPLKLLADHLRGADTAIPRPARVIATAEMLTAETRDYLRETFGCPVLDFYGMTEMGLVAWQAPGAQGYSTSSDIITELLPNAACEGRCRLVLTNLELRTCPLIRFDSGDIALVGNRDGKPVIAGFEGRAVDSIRCRDGSELSPYRVTMELQNVPGLRRFKITQRQLLEFVVAAELDPGERDAARERIRTILTGLVGDDIALDFEIHEQLVPDGAVKFRPVESLLTRC